MAMGSTGVPLRPLRDVLEHFCPAALVPAVGAPLDLLAIFTALGGEMVYAALAAARRPPRTRTHLPAGEPASAAGDLRHIASYIDTNPPLRSLATWDDLAMAWGVEGAVDENDCVMRIELLIGTAREWQTDEAARHALTGKLSAADLPVGGFSNMQGTLVPALERWQSSTANG